MEKKNKRKIMLENYYQARHLAALERNDLVLAKKWLDLLQKLN